MTDIEDRINECMQRSMHGKPLPMDSPEMIAMASYLRSLGARYAPMGAGSKKAVEPSAFKTPARRADRRKGYLFPPLWGPDSFNDGAGMGRVLTAAKFIKARLPLGKPDLTDDEAFDVAAFINSKPRPQMPNLEKDYPDRATKPVDNPYGPFADSFSGDHKYGPFQPIEACYKALKESKDAARPKAAKGTK